MYKKNKIDCSKFRRYEKKEKKLFSKYTEIKILEGLISSKDHIYKLIDFNTFEDKETKIPKGYKLIKVSKKWIKEYACDNNKQLINKNNILFKNIKKKTKGFTKYFTHSNFFRPYLVYIKKNKVYIYKIDNKKYYYKKNDLSKKDKSNAWIYTKLIKEYNTKKIFIGKNSGKSKSLNIKDNIKYSIGNSILLKLNNNKYVFIGETIYEFSTNDEIVKFYSLIGNNDVPYPIALGKENVYFMIDEINKPNKYIPRKYFSKNMKNIDFEDTYYGYNDIKLPQNTKKYNFKNFKRIDIAI